MSKIFYQLICIAIMAMVGMNVNAQTTTFTYTANNKLERFDEIQYFIGATAVQSHEFEGNTGTVVYEGTVTELGSNALLGNSDLLSIVIPEGVKKIGFQAFKWCVNMTDISLPTSLEEIGGNAGLAFDGCSALANGHFVIKDLKWWCSLDINGIYSNPVYYAKHIYNEQGEEILDLVIPDDVTEIGNCAFSRCEGLESVSFHENLTYIGGNAFSYCTGLTEVVLPNNLKKIDEYAFTNCSNLESVTIPEGVEEIGFSAFAHSGLKSLILPSTITKMSQSFVSCEQMETLTLTDGITTLAGSFYYCHALKEVRIPGSVKAMTFQDFNSCNALETVIIDDGVEEVAGFQRCPKLKNITLASSVRKLDSFSGCTGLQSVFLPEGVEYIASFNGCTSLQQINIPSTVTYVGTFSGCNALEKVTVADMKSWCEARHYDSTWYGPQKMAGKLYLGSVEDNSEVTSLVIPEGTARIEAGAFYGLPNIVSVSIPGSVKYLGGNTFGGCTGLTEIVLPEGLETVGYMDFAGCTQLSKLTIPSTATKFDSEAFVQMPAIADVWCRAFPNELYWRDYTIGNPFMAEKATLFHVVNAAAWQEKYPEANVTFVADIDVPSTTITYNADARLDAFDDYTKFKGAYGLLSHEFADGQGTVTYQGDVNGVGAYSFKDVDGLTSVTIPEGTTNIDNSAFSGCTSLTSMVIPATVTSIGDYAFRGCTQLATLTIVDPETIPSAPTKAPAAQSLGLRHIGRAPFDGCPLASLSFPATLDDIEEEAFVGMAQLADVYFKADAADVDWRGYNNSYMFMPNKATECHVNDAAAWEQKFPDTNVTFVDSQSTAVNTVSIYQGTTDNARYNINGQRVNANYKGVVITNGKKVVVNR